MRKKGEKSELQWKDNQHSTVLYYEQSSKIRTLSNSKESTHLKYVTALNGAPVGPLFEKQGEGYI